MIRRYMEESCSDILQHEEYIMIRCTDHGSIRSSVLDSQEMEIGCEIDSLEGVNHPQNLKDDRMAHTI